MTAKSKTEIANIEQQNATAVLTATDPLLAMIERASRDPTIDLDRMERLIKMRERDQDVAAEGAFNDALAAVQQELTPVARDSNNPQTHSKYASYFAVDKVVRPVRSKYGFSLTFDTEDGAPEGYIRVVAYLAKGRHSRKYRYDSPTVTTGIKGNEMMTLTHARASALTYAKRYLVGLIFDLSTGEDKDGNQIGGKTVNTDAATDEQVMEIYKMLGKSEKDRVALCKHLGIDALENMTVATYEQAKGAIAARKKRIAEAKKEAAEAEARLKQATKETVTEDGEIL